MSYTPWATAPIQIQHTETITLKSQRIRIMCGVGRDTSCRQLFKDCKILTITSLYILEVLCFIKKYKLAIQKNEQVHDHNTRRSKYLHIKPCNTNLYKKV